MRDKTKYILNYLIILVFLFLEYSWFENLPPPYLRLSAAILLLLAGLKIFLERRRICSFIGSLSKSIRTFIANNKLYTVLLTGILLLAVTMGLFAVIYAEGAMNADEAVEGVMAMHIYRGMHRPITIYKMPINYVLKSYLAALAFNLTGPSAKALQAVDLLFYFGILLFMYLLALDAFGKEAALITLFLLAVPPSSFYYTCLLRTGEYNEILFLGIVVLFLTYRYAAAPGAISRETPGWFFSLTGFLWGVGFSVQALMAVFITSTLVVLFLKDIKHFFKHILWRLAVFSFVGYFPLVIHNIRTNFSTFRFLMHPPKAPHAVPAIEAIKNMAYNISLAFGNIGAPAQGGTGLGFEGTIQVIAVTLLLGLCAVSIIYFLWKKRPGLAYWVLILPVIVTIFLNLHPARPGPRPHYMIPLFASVPLFLAWWLSTFRWKLKYLVLFLIFITNMTAIVGQLLYFRERDLGRMALISRLRDMGIRYVGTGFWQAYPITFITKEEIICTGRYGVWSRHARKGEPIKNVKYDPYDDRFHEALKDNPRSCAFLLEGTSGFEKRLIKSLKTPVDRTTVGRYKIYTFRASS